MSWIRVHVPQKCLGGVLNMVFHVTIKLLRMCKVHFKVEKVFFVLFFFPKGSSVQDRTEQQRHSVTFNVLSIYDNS